MIPIVFALLSSLGGGQPPPQPPAGPVMAATTPEYERVKGFLLRSAEQMPDVANCGSKYH